MKFWVLLFLPLFSWAEGYYVKSTGNDNNSGSITAPWKTLLKVNSELAWGDTIYFYGGDTFNGTITMQDSRIVYTTYGSGKATILSDNSGFIAQNKSYITLTNLIFKANTALLVDGIMIRQQGDNTFSDVQITNVEVEGYGGKGIGIYGNNTPTKVAYPHTYPFENIYIKNSLISRCGAGIDIGGKGIFNVRLDDCTIRNTSGIKIGLAKNVNVKNSRSYDNSSVGFEFSSCEDVSITNNESYNNLGGFSLTNVYNGMLSANKSHDNARNGYYLFDNGTRPSVGMIVKYNSSFNDGRKSGASLALGSTKLVGDYFIYSNDFKTNKGYLFNHISGTFFNVNIYNNYWCATLPALFQRSDISKIWSIYNNTSCNTLPIDTVPPVIPQIPPRRDTTYLTAFPNPVTSQVNFRLVGPRGFYDIEVLNSTGTVVYKANINVFYEAHMVLSMRNFYSGLYTVRARNASTVLYSKFVKL